MSLPHGTSRKLAVRVSQSHVGKLGLGQDEFTEGVLGITYNGSGWQMALLFVYMCNMQTNPFFYRNRNQKVLRVPDFHDWHLT